MSLSTLAGRDQGEFFLQILHMSTQELSDNLRENGLSEEGDKATKQARLRAAVSLLEVNIRLYLPYLADCFRRASVLKQIAGLCFAEPRMRIRVAKDG